MGSIRWSGKNFKNYRKIASTEFNLKFTHLPTLLLLSQGFYLLRIPMKSKKLHSKINNKKSKFQQN